MRVISPSHEITYMPEPGIVLQAIEAAGRTCYKSEDRITQDSAAGFVRRIVKSGHHSVLEHMSITVRFTCDRGVSHELVRHRLAAYSQESTRYANYSKDRFGSEITVIAPCYWPDIPAGSYSQPRPGLLLCDGRQIIPNRLGIPRHDPDRLADDRVYVCPNSYGWIYSCLCAEDVYLIMLADIDAIGNPKDKAAPEEARTVLPNSLKTEIVMTANLREWKHVLNLRCSRPAHPQIREIMLPLLKELHEKLPEVFEAEYEKYKEDINNV